MDQNTQPACGQCVCRVALPPARANTVYVSGPMSGYENLNFPAFDAAAQTLRSKGYAVRNPADHGVVAGAAWGDYLRADVAQLAGCEGVHLLKGWEASSGAQLELYVAQVLGCTITTAPDAGPVLPIHPINQAVRDALCERARQVHDEGCSSARDDRYTSQELALAAAAYALSAAGLVAQARVVWPWVGGFKPGSMRRDMQKAAALCIAELERLAREQGQEVEP